jgi:hypothetical protein
LDTVVKRGRVAHSKKPRKGSALGPCLLNSYEPNITRWLAQDHIKIVTETIEGLMGTQGAAFIAPYRRLLHEFVADFAYAARRLKGIRVSWLDTHGLIASGERPSELSAEDAQTILCLAAAIRHVSGHPHSIRLSVATLMSVNGLLTRGVQGKAGDEPRPASESLASAEHENREPPLPHAMGMPIEQLCEKTGRIQDPCEQALFILGMLIMLLPFAHANLQTAMVCMNIPLLNAELPPLPFTEVSQHELKAALRRLCTLGDPSALADVFTKAYARSTPHYMELLALMKDGCVTRSLV